MMLKRGDFETDSFPVFLLLVLHSVTISSSVFCVVSISLPVSIPRFSDKRK